MTNDPRPAPRRPRPASLFTNEERLSQFLDLIAEIAVTQVHRLQVARAAAAAEGLTEQPTP